MELKVKYREAQCEDSTPSLVITRINGDDSSRVLNLSFFDDSSRVLNLSFLDNFFRDNEKDLENCDVIIGSTVELNEELFNFITTKFYNVARKCNMGLSIISYNRNMHYAYDFIEKCKNYGIKFQHYRIRYFGGIITL